MASVPNCSPIQSLPLIKNSSDGTASSTNTILGPCVRFPIPFSFALASIANGDLIITYPLGASCGGSGKIVGFTASTTSLVTTGSKGSTLNLEIDGTNVTGGVLTLTSALMDAVTDPVISATAITGNNTFTATSTLDLEAASTTAFVEGAATFHVWVELDNADNNFATIAASQAGGV